MAPVNPYFPGMQPFTGHLYAPSPVTPALAKTGQVSPHVQRRLAPYYGRYLSGLGQEESMEKRTPPSAPMEKKNLPAGLIEDDEEVFYEDVDRVYADESMDDVLGSGIFDPAHRQGTANVDAGVFASNYSLPGYIARETPFTVNEDVTDLPSDGEAQVVTVPGGGMAYIERYGRLVGPPPAPKKLIPQRLPAAPTGRMQPYARMRERYPNEATRRAAVPAADRSQGEPIFPKLGGPLPYVYQGPPTPKVSKGHMAYQPDFQIDPAPATPLPLPTPMATKEKPVELVSRVNPAVHDVPIRKQQGIGQDDADQGSSQWLKYGLVGLGIGALAYMALEAGNKKGRRR